MLIFFCSRRCLHLFGSDSIGARIPYKVTFPHSSIIRASALTSSIGPYRTRARLRKRCFIVYQIPSIGLKSGDCASCQPGSVRRQASKIVGLQICSHEIPSPNKDLIFNSLLPNITNRPPFHHRFPLPSSPLLTSLLLLTPLSSLLLTPLPSFISLPLILQISPLTTNPTRQVLAPRTRLAPAHTNTRPRPATARARTADDVPVIPRREDGA